MNPWIAAGIGVLIGVIAGMFLGLRMAIMVQRAYSTEIDLAGTASGEQK